MLKGKRILHGVTGGIAAYKGVELCRRLVKAGAEVRVVLTRAATEFITPLTFRVITGKAVPNSLFESLPDHELPHVSLPEEADLILIAPATANMIAKAARGIADDLLSTLLVGATPPIVFAPAMDNKMFLNTATQDNIESLRNRGVIVMNPDFGELASGETGWGRLPDVDDIMTVVEENLARGSELEGKTVIVTAGATQEPLDAIRYITNRSTGRMGYALAEAVRDRGGRTLLVSAPTALWAPWGVEQVQVRTAEEMRQAVLGNFDRADAVIMAAAVMNFRPSAVADGKAKPATALPIANTPDILAELGRSKKHQLLVGFAAETGDLVSGARAKLKAKNVDLIVANDVTKSDSGFGADTNQALIVDRSQAADKLPLMSKKELARIIVERLAGMFAGEVAGD